jgi:hypothetical protein
MQAIVFEADERRLDYKQNNPTESKRTVYMNREGSSKAACSYRNNKCFGKTYKNGKQTYQAHNKKER